MRTLIALMLLPLVCSTTGAEEKKDTAKVTGTFVIPKESATFKDRIVEIRLYRFDPRIADKGADLVEKVEMKAFAHTTGTETKKEFEIGGKAALDPKSGYYLTFFILDGTNRTHIGDAEHAPKNLCKVLTNGQPNKVAFTVREIKR